MAIVLVAVVALALVVAGCGGGEGVEEDATVTVYVAAAACPEAQRTLAGAGGGVGSLRVRARCLPSIGRRGHLDLARIGANARRATQDSSTIAYIGEAEPAATRFSKTILEEADIAHLPGMSGAAAMTLVLRAVQGAEGSEGLREAVREAISRFPPVGGFDR